MTARERIKAKEDAIKARLEMMIENHSLLTLVSMVDEARLDSMILFLGIGRVELND